VAGDLPISLHYLEQGLHSTPKIMPLKIQEKIDQILADINPQKIILGYGLCSNGILGVSSNKTPITIPRCHDCIALLLGSVKSYNEYFRNRPGTYFLTCGWVELNQDPLSSVEIRYAPRMGIKKAKRAMDLELINYTHICFINNGLGDIEKIRARTLENCLAFKKEFIEIPGTLDYFKELVTDTDEERNNFITLTDKQSFNEAMFYNVGRPGIF
jgi:hypothetical protein